MTIEEVVEELEGTNDWCRVTAKVNAKNKVGKLFTIVGLNAEYLTPIQTVTASSSTDEIPVNEEDCTPVTDIIEWLKTKPQDTEQIYLRHNYKWTLYQIDHLSFEYGYVIFSLDVISE